jgi:hypothetical protein
MQTSRKLTHAIVALFALVMMSVAALAADPGTPYSPFSDVSDQKAGSILVYNVYSSNAANAAANDTRINITNTSSTSGVIVHLFFVAEGCAVADFKLPMSENFTYTFRTSEFDPGINGYIVAVASDSDGLPHSHNWLIGDEYVKLATPAGASANLGAEAIAAHFADNTSIGNKDATTATLRFGIDYNRLPAVVAVSNIPSRANQNQTTLILNRISGSLAETMDSVPRLFTLVYDDQEVAYSASIPGGSCQRSIILSDDVPRTAPRFTSIIPAGRSGWMRIYSQDGSIPLLGAVINYNPTVGSADAFSGGHNLHKLRFTSTVINVTIPVFPF